MNIVGVGMCTPLGIRWATSAAEMDAGTSRFGETQIETEPGEHLRAVVSPLLPIGMDRTQRCTALAVTSLRDADNEKKPELLATLRDTPCSHADICAVRGQCLAAYELHVEVLRRLAGVMANVGAGAGNQGDLEGMKRDLGRSKELTGECTDAQGEMMRKYKL